MREDNITGISREFDQALKKVMFPEKKEAQERDMEMANCHKTRPEEAAEEMEASSEKRQAGTAGLVREKMPKERDKMPEGGLV